MKKAIWIMVGTFAAIAIGIAAWVVIGALTQKGATNEVTQPKAVERTDLTAEQSPQVIIKDLSFTPPNIKVKSGTTVTWVNKDTMNHSVIAEESTNTGDLPTQDVLFGKNETFTVTFKKVGTFKYMCGPHAFMHGSVEVVD